MQTLCHPRHEPAAFPTPRSTIIIPMRICLSSHLQETHTLQFVSLSRLVVSFLVVSLTIHTSRVLKSVARAPSQASPPQRNYMRGRSVHLPSFCFQKQLARLVCLVHRWITHPGPPGHPAPSFSTCCLSPSPLLTSFHLPAKRNQSCLECLSVYHFPLTQISTTTATTTIKKEPYSQPVIFNESDRCLNHHQPRCTNRCSSFLFFPFLSPPFLPFVQGWLISPRWHYGIQVVGRQRQCNGMQCNALECSATMSAHL